MAHEAKRQTKPQRTAPSSTPGRKMETPEETKPSSKNSRPLVLIERSCGQRLVIYMDTKPHSVSILKRCSCESGHPRGVSIVASTGSLGTQDIVTSLVVL